MCLKTSVIEMRLCHWREMCAGRFDNEMGKFSEKKLMTQMVSRMTVMSCLLKLRNFKGNIYSLNADNTRAVN